MLFPSNKMEITLFEPISYITRLTFDGRMGSLRPENGIIELVIDHDTNTPIKPIATPFKSLVSTLNNRFILDENDPLFYSGLLEPKDGQSVQEYYINNTKNLAQKFGIWFSSDNSVPQHTLGGVSIAAIYGQPTVETFSKVIAYYLKQMLISKGTTESFLPNYKAITFKSSNKSGTYRFENLPDVL